MLAFYSGIKYSISLPFRLSVLKGFLINVVDAKFQVITAIRMKANAFETVVTIYHPAGRRIPEVVNLRTLHMLMTVIFHVPHCLFLDVVKVKLFVSLHEGV
jgi:hypothetical protein